MSVFKKVVKVAELPVDWASEFSNPEQLVVVTIRDNDLNTNISTNQKLNHQINLATPTKADKLALAAMTSFEQKALYENAILKASAQSGRKISKEEIKSSALKHSIHG